LLAADATAAESHFLAAQIVIQELQDIDPAREPIYREDLSNYAPLAEEVLLRVSSRPIYQRALIGAYLWAGEAARRRGDLRKAEAQFTASLEQVEGLHEERGKEPATIGLRATVRYHMARLMFDLGALSATAEHANMALVGYRLLAEADPKHVGWRNAIAETEEVFGAAIRASQRPR
jgi:hypothetical protein